jgi:hypothetical protein
LGFHVVLGNTTRQALTTYAAKVEEKSKQGKMKSKMTKKEIKKKMENVLKRGDFKMKIGRLMFWDFGGQYVYYTTHQTFMTYRALFLVVLLRRCIYIVIEQVYLYCN